MSARKQEKLDKTRCEEEEQEQLAAKFTEREKTPDKDEHYLTDPSDNEHDPFSPDNSSDDYNPGNDSALDDSDDSSEEESEEESFNRGNLTKKHITAEDSILPQDKENILVAASEVSCDLEPTTTSDVNSVNGKKKVFNLPEKKSRKRVLRPEAWSRNVSALARQQGKAYISQKTKKEVQQKAPELGLLCKNSCRKRCNEKFSSNDREEIFRKFYKLDQNSKNVFLFKSIRVAPVKRRRKIRASDKSSTFSYTVTCNKKIATVCKTAFMSLYQISHKKIQLLQNQLNSGITAPSPDKRGRHDSRPNKKSDEVVDFIKKHIDSFPAEQSHYSRNKNANKKYLSPLLNISKMYELYKQCVQENKLDNAFLVKKSFYAYIFSKEFNLSFSTPKTDTCSTCDSGLKSEEHSENFNFAFEQQKVDRQYARINKDILYLTMDLQQTMPLPRITTSKAFYLRQMWFYNFGIHTISTDGDKSYFFTWTEDTATKGSVEIGSSLHTFVQLLSAEKKIDHLVIWSDSCSGQNKNFNIISLYQYLILKGYVKIIDHKFPEVGHSFLDSDRDFGRIEKEMRKHEKVFTADHYRDIIKSASKNNSIVTNMKDHFKDLNEIPIKLNLFNRKKNSLNEKVCLRDNVKWIRVENFGEYMYKDSLDPNTPFLKVDIMKYRSEYKNAKDYTILPIKNKKK
ncbi:unnamed protein product [Ceutorhynchus assimilis]|uniref:DUF7869 domain-containing protein n=1 Tax=Ceutorhynchus assimilis TaxID=467358 RepID=A0A9N9MMH2_9CUCU|nr:unnamed protein product [Ceutorhynchus assimilis]